MFTTVSPPLLCGRAGLPLAALSTTVTEPVKYMEPAAVSVVTVVLIVLVHAWGGDEQAICDDGPCAVGSGASWLLTGGAMVTPTAVWSGVAWARRLHRNADLGPFAHRAIPDIEEIAEIAMVLVAIGVSYLVIRNGPSTPMLESSWPNSWLEDRLGRDGRHPLVPARGTWFVVGALLAVPVFFSAGTALGREWFGRRPSPSAELVEE